MKRIKRNKMFKDFRAIMKEIDIEIKNCQEENFEDFLDVTVTLVEDLMTELQNIADGIDGIDA